MSTNIFDLNNLAIRTFCSKDIEGTTDNPNIQLWKYFLIDSIYKSLFHGDVSEVILAVDDRKSWRKLYWDRYKESRKLKRDSSNINWDVFHSEYNNFTSEIRGFLPFKVISAENAEADDVIGILTQKDNRDYVVISNDEDYLQIVSDHVKVYNPTKMEFMTCDDPEMFVVTKCLTGQSKDDIFSIVVPDDHPKGKRKPGFGAVSAKKVIDSGYKEWLDEKGDEYKKRFRRNRILIDFKLIPNVIRTRILNTYTSYKLAPPDKIYEFFDRNKFGSFLEDFNIVESKLLKLY